MSRVCSLPIRSPFCRLITALNVAQRQQYHVLSLVRSASGFSDPQTCRSSNTAARRLRVTQSRDFSSSFRPLARKRGPRTSNAPSRSERQAPRTWQHYDPNIGIPLESGQLDQTTIETIFGPGIDEQHGNHVLRLMNYRRISGSLIDVGAIFPPSMQIPEDEAIKALTYLRDLDPAFDEQAAGAAWAEAEVARVEQEYMARAEKLGIYKKVEDEQARKDTADQDLYGESALVALRRENKARWMEEDRKKKELREKKRIEELTRKGATNGSIVHNAKETSPPEADKEDSSDSVALKPPVPKAWLQPMERKSWVKYYEEQATIVKENKVPQLSLLRRLGPSALLALAVFGGCIALHEMYTPPPKSARIFPDIPPAIATLGTITAINLAVLVAWRMPPLWRMMNKYFLVTPGLPYATGVFTAQFSHQTASHLLYNAVLLWPFGIMLHEDVGRGTFLAICIASGTLGAYGSLVYNVLLRRWSAYIFGGSAAVWGVIAAACLARSEQHATVAGYDLPLTGMTVLGFLGGIQILLAWKGKQINVDYAGHLCGMASGSLAVLYIRHQAAQREMTRKNYLPASPLSGEESS